MATITRTKTWISGDTLTAADLNAEFNHLLDALALGDSDISGGIAASKISGTAVTLAGTQTLTNKTLTAPIINSPTGDVATKTGSETLTNKTLTAPIINNPTLNVNPSHGTAKFAADVSAESPLSIVANATANPFSALNNFSGLMIITSLNDGGTAVFLVGGATVVLVSQTTTIFSATVDTASKINVYQDASLIIIQNKTVSNPATLNIMTFRTRTQL